MDPDSLTLLVPLDGSKTAECAIEAADCLAHAAKCRILLLHALEQNPPGTVHGERHLAAPGEAGAYLEQIASRLRGDGAEVETHVHPGGVRNVADSIREHADEIKPDLVVLSTHGRSGLRHLVFGTIAESVLAHSAWPILLVPALRTERRAFKLERFLFPFDATHRQDEALERTVKLARFFHAETHLLFVVPTPPIAREQSAAHRLMPTAGRALLEIETSESEAYIARVAERFQSPDVRMETKVLRGDTVDEVISYADALDADLIAMATHGRASLTARVEGNTISRLLHRAERPLLLVRTNHEAGRG